MLSTPAHQSKTRVMLAAKENYVHMPQCWRRKLQSRRATAGESREQSIISTSMKDSTPSIPAIREAGSLMHVANSHTSLPTYAPPTRVSSQLTRDHLRYMGSVGQNFGVDPNSMNMVVGIHSRNVVSGLATRVGLTPENLLPTIDLNRRLVNLAIRTRGDYLAAHERRHDLTMVSGVGASSSPVPAPSTTSPAEESSDSVHSSSTTTTAPIPTASLSVMQAPPPKQPAPTRLRAPHHPQQGSDAKSQVTTPGQGSPATSLLALPVAAEVASTLSSSHSSSTSGVLFAKSSGASHGCSPRMQVQALGSDSEEQASSKGAGVTHQPPAARCASDSSTAKTMAGHNKRSSEGEEVKVDGAEIRYSISEG